MLRRNGRVALWGVVVVLMLSSLTVPSTSRPGFSPGPATAPGRSSPFVPADTSALTPSDGIVTVAPAFVSTSGVTVTGPVPADAPMTVEVGLALSNPAGLNGLVSAEYAFGLPQYHEFEAPSELAERYGPSLSTVSAATGYFAGFGLSVVPSPDRLLLSVSGPSARVATAFGTAFLEYRAANGHSFVSHATPASLPAGIPWSGALGLGNATSLDPEVVGPLSPADDLSADAGCTAALGDLTPCDFWQAYNVSSLLANGTNGSGVRLAVVDPYSSAETEANLTSDLATFAADNGLSAGSVDYVYPVPTSEDLNASTNPSWSLEDALDLEWARASAPGATIDMAFSPNSGAGLYEAVDWLVAHQAVNVISMSWGEPDVGIFNAYDTPCSAACNASTDGSYALLAPVLDFAAAEGISVFAASGDCGAADGTSAESTNFPASDPDVTGVGGTVLHVGPSGNWTSEVAWSGNSSGATAPGCYDQGGSGGGFAPFPRPTWQTGLPAGTTHRGVPDVALDAGSPVAIVVRGTTVGVLGTSVATPTWAGIAAIADQYSGRPLGLLNPAIYAIAAGTNYSRDFHDIDSGSNGYSAGNGWDPVTGVGSPKVAFLVGDLAHPALVASSDLATFVYASPRLGRAPLTVNFAVEATGGSGAYPLEGVAFGNGNASFAPDGNTSYTFASPGVYSVQAYVSDSVAHYAVSPPVAVVVGGGGALSVELAASSETLAVDAPVLFSVHVVGGRAPYTFDYAFGDGTYLDAMPADNVTHIYGAPGSFCPAVVVADSNSPANGAASPRVAVAVGGASLPDCRNDTVPLSVSAETVGVRDAPADFSSLFHVTGGAGYSGAPAPSLQYSSTDPYVSACECAIFRAPGTYPVEGFANDSETEQANASATVTVAPPLIGTFSASTTFGSAPLTVNFSASASGGYGANAANTVWTLGNGQQAEGSHASETYRTPGFYLALGHLADMGQGNASEAFLIDVGPAPALASTRSPPSLVATVTPAIDVAWGATVNFSAQLYSAEGGPLPALFHWQLGTNASAFRPSFNWTYPDFTTANNLTVELSATLADNGEMLNATLELPSFNGGRSDGYERAVDGLEFGPAAPLEEPEVGLPWGATAPVLAGPGNLSVSWTLGDGTSEVGRAVSHLFREGLYTVTVAAHDSWGDNATGVFGVAAWAVPRLNATFSPTTGPAPLEVVFSAGPGGGVGPPYFYTWSFGNGASVDAANGTYTLLARGVYVVSVTVTDDLGFVAEENWTVTVEPPFTVVAVGILAVGAGLGAMLAFAMARPRRRIPSDASVSP
ncbi:MAG TPA: PKD domain-containing protein [Thermoplasmata archaeon]|jgi:PKD repeat protein|nr:PKD domain-containing protein [Thermoplasmata archaeon]